MVPSKKMGTKEVVSKKQKGNRKNHKVVSKKKEAERTINFREMWKHTKEAEIS